MQTVSWFLKFITFLFFFIRAHFMWSLWLFRIRFTLHSDFFYCEIRPIFSLLMSVWWRIRIHPFWLASWLLDLDMSEIVISIVIVCGAFNVLLYVFFHRPTSDNTESLDVRQPLVLRVKCNFHSWLFISSTFRFKNEASINVLAQDHRNDCISNFVALTCALLAS